MQTMDMGSSEAAALTQMSISPIPNASSSSYFLQLDPSGHIDILESSLVLSKPDMADETVYEIQLDPCLMDERNVEIINLQNLQNAVTFQPEFIEEHQFTTFDPNVQYQLEDMSLNHMLVNNSDQEVAEVTVPDFTVETEVASETEGAQTQQATAVMNNVEIHEEVIYQQPTEPMQIEIPFVQEYLQTEGNHSTDVLVKEEIVQQQQELIVESHLPTPQTSQKSESEKELQEQTEKAKDKPDSEKIHTDDSTPQPPLSEKLNQEPNVDLIHSSPEKNADSVNSELGKSKQETKKGLSKRKSPEFTEATMMPVVEMFPSLIKTPAHPVVDIYDDEENEEIQEGKAPLKSAFLYDRMDPDDELYISYHSRPDPNRTAMCILCYEWFETMDDLDKHLKSTHQDNMKLYGCKKCGKQFWSRFLRQRHEKQHRFDLKGPIQRYLPKNRPFDHFEHNHFYKRLRPAPMTETYREHIKLIQAQIKSTEFECIQCGRDFRTEEECREHYDEEHALQTCLHCRKVCESAKLLRQHEQEIHGLYTIKRNYPGGAWKLWESWDCEEMKERDERLVNLSLFHNYYKRHKTDPQSKEVDSATTTCDNFIDMMGCEEVTVNDYDALKTVEKKKPQEKSSSPSKVKKVHSSSHADASKPRKTDLKSTSSKLQDYDKIVFVGMTNSSETLVKREDLPFKCDTCETSFDNDIDLQRHLKSHAVRSMAYMCQYCGRGFATHSNRKEHERIHTGDKPYVCPICTRAFVQISNLKKHIQTHKDKNNLQCSTCNKQFVKESSLILHQRAHSQDRKFRCHICDRAYNYASLLKRHMRIHTGENPYSCEDCGMQFHELVSLHYHRKKVHTGERPHRCDTCGRAFILSSDLKKHLRIHLRDANSIKSRSDGGSPIKSNSTDTQPEKASTATTGAIDNSFALDPSSDVLYENEVADNNIDSISHLHEDQDEDMTFGEFDQSLKESDHDPVLAGSEKNQLNVPDINMTVPEQVTGVTKVSENNLTIESSSQVV